eukprot:2209264-Pyramimonas_sp.AAC.1
MLALGAVIVTGGAHVLPYPRHKISTKGVLLEKGDACIRARVLHSYAQALTQRSKHCDILAGPAVNFRRVRVDPVRGESSVNLRRSKADLLGNEARRDVMEANHVAMFLRVGPAARSR